jgi:hypothetical protein
MRNVTVETSNVDERRVRAALANVKLVIAETRDSGNAAV